MEQLTITLATTPGDIAKLAKLANEIWHQHFTPIIGEAQVNYMVDQFQSAPALTEQINEGYEYFMLFYDGVFSGYVGVHEENGSLFLSKLYIHEGARGKHISTATFHYLVDLCKNRCLDKIWLTCNKHNDHTLSVYEHLGFITTRSQVTNIGNGFVMDDYILEYAIQ